jgi:DNA-binding NarL/FixJ family response regulator
VATGLATLAWIRHAQGDPAAALDAMEEAARVAPGRGVASTLNPSRRSGRGCCWPRCSGSPTPRAAAAVPGLVEPLSGRELEVLRLLAAGRPNQEIAEELVVALSIVKKHVTHILDKLGATNRTQATARARELGLLP